MVLRPVVSIVKTLSEGDEETYDPATLPPGTTGSAAEIATMDAELAAATGEAESSTFINESIQLQKAQSSAKIAATRQKLDETQQALSQVNSTLHKRATGELPNPSVNFSAVDSATQNILASLSGTLSQPELDSIESSLAKANNRSMDDFEEFVADRVVAPYNDNTAALDIIRAQLIGEEELGTSAIFDTVFGPPVSYTGKYLLSEDGIYYGL